LASAAVDREEGGWRGGEEIFLDETPPPALRNCSKKLLKLLREGGNKKYGEKESKSQRWKKEFKKKNLKMSLKRT